jgi:hypothetical protein
MLGPLLLASCSRPPEGLTLELPIACEPGRTCWVQNYVDDDPSDAARDHRCGARTYDGHKGTDIRLRNVTAMRAGVDVLAAAPGTVRAVRNGEPERLLRDGEDAPEGRECGNGVVLDHGAGWETQYCHLARGSVRVAPGDVVRAGQPLGQVGLSGNTQFPHLHLAVRRNDVVVDPFAWGIDMASCTGGRSLWSDAAATTMPYHTTQVLEVGFSAAPVTLESAEAGDVPPPTANGPAMIAWVRVMGLRQGDVQQIRLVNPAGQVVTSHVSEPLPRDKATYVLFAGKPNRGQLARGRWTMTYSVVRDGEVVLTADDSTELTEQGP